jgi:pyridinium-3,5-biscarboxylic acid mononucleotide synthase
MDITHLTRLLEAVQARQIGIADALDELKTLPYEDLGFARLDHHRALRTGFPEIVFGASKTPEQIAAILERLAARNRIVLCTRASEEAFVVTQRVLPHAVYHAQARIIVVEEPNTTAPERFSGVAVVSAGTSDLAVAEEVALVAEAMGHRVERITDVGVAGLHRVLATVECLRACNVVVVVAGMEGALPSVVAGLVDVPVIAVPTSVGYGASFGGVAALLGMLNSCALGMAVVNIDNGVGAGVMAAMINRQAHGGTPAHGDGR